MNINDLPEGHTPVKLVGIIREGNKLVFIYEVTNRIDEFDADMKAGDLIYHTIEVKE